MQAAVHRDRFDGDDLLSCDSAHRCRARSHCLAIAMHRARSAQAHPATKLRAAQPGDIADIPQQRHLRIAVKSLLLPIEFEFNHFPLSARPALKILYRFPKILMAIARSKVPEPAS